MRLLADLLGAAPSRRTSMGRMPGRAPGRAPPCDPRPGARARINGSLHGVRLVLRPQPHATSVFVGSGQKCRRGSPPSRKPAPTLRPFFSAIAMRARTAASPGSGPQPGEAAGSWVPQPRAGGASSPLGFVCRRPPVRLERRTFRHSTASPPPQGIRTRKFDEKVNLSKACLCLLAKQAQCLNPDGRKPT